MADFNCANLVNIVGNKILLVRTKGKEIFYLPGGKIESGESLEYAVIREIKEELNIQMDKQHLEYLDNIITRANPEVNKTVSIHCFKYRQKLSTVSAKNEIAEAKYIHFKDRHLMADAVHVLIDKIQLGEIHY